MMGKRWAAEKTKPGWAVATVPLLGAAWRVFWWRPQAEVREATKVLRCGKERYQQIPVAF